MNIELAAVIAGVIGLISLFGFYEYEHCKILTVQNQSLTAQIADLKADSVAQGKRITQAKQQADVSVDAIQQQTNSILSTNVATDCDDAIKWGVQKSHDFN